MTKYEYKALIYYFDKNLAYRVERKTILARNKQDAIEKINKLGKIKNITWEETPGIIEDLQLKLFSD